MTPAKELPGASNTFKFTVAAVVSVKRYHATSAEPLAIVPLTRSRQTLPGLPTDCSVRSGAAVRTGPAVTGSNAKFDVQLGPAGTVRVSSSSTRSGAWRRRVCRDD